MPIISTIILVLSLCLHNFQELLLAYSPQSLTPVALLMGLRLTLFKIILLLTTRSKKKKDRPLSDDETRDKVPDEISTEKLEEEKRLQLKYILYLFVLYVGSKFHYT